MLILALSGCGKGNTQSSTEGSGSASGSGSAASASEQASSASESNASSSSGEAVDDTFFDDAVFVGDSVSLKLSYYVEKVRNDIGLECLGQAEFLCSGSLGFANALWDIDDPNNVHPLYKGETYLVQDGIAATGAKKVFIMLGMNDFALYGTEETIENAKTLIGKILDKTPDASIYIQSVTPIVSGKEAGEFNNANIVVLNEALKKMCSENGYKYINVAEVMADDSGCLKSEYCSDPDSQGIHFTDEACEKWIKYLQENAG